MNSWFPQSQRQIKPSDIRGEYSSPDMKNEMLTFQEAQISEDLFEVYSCLSEVLIQSVRFGLPEWIALSGEDWPLFEVCTRLAIALENPKLNRCAVAIAEVPISSLDSLLDEYERLFFGAGSPPVWLYESHYIGGRIFGPTTSAIHNIYREAGLEIVGAELADHAGMELAFLAFLAGREKTDLEFCLEWKQARDLFTRNHAGRWLPEVGKKISQSENPAWSSIGLILSAIFSPALNQDKQKKNIPEIEEPELCTLCGFCVQVCPPLALRIDEDEKTTCLELEKSLCTSCGKCIDICPEEVMTLSASLNDQPRILLRESPLAHCSICGDTTFSQAELDYTQEILGNPDWLSYCLKCRYSGDA